MELKKLNYKSVPWFGGLKRCKKRAHGQGTNSPPEFSLIKYHF